MQLGPYALACFTPLHGSTAWGAFQRNECTGGAANGTPLKDTMLPAGTPATRPPVTLTSRISANASGPNDAKAIAIARPATRILTVSPPSLYPPTTGSTT